MSCRCIIYYLSFFYLLFFCCDDISDNPVSKVSWVFNMRASLIRLEGSDEGIIGQLKIEDRLICYTLEHPEKLIPPGIYDCVSYPSTNYGMTYLVKVPGRSYILFHWGNRAKDTTGCILTGRNIGWLYKERAVLDSKKAFDDMKRALKQAKLFTLQVMELAT